MWHNMDAFHHLYQEFSKDVFRFAVYLSGDTSLAENITSETFIRAWTSSAPIRQPTTKAYLFTIARNLYLRQMRKTSVNTTLPEDLADRSPDLHTAIEKRSELATVMTALQTLPEVDRAALLMRSAEAMSHAEIAAALKISVEAVRVKIHRARKKLHDLK